MSDQTEETIDRALKERLRRPAAGESYLEPDPVSAVRARMRQRRNHRRRTAAVATTAAILIAAGIIAIVDQDSDDESLDVVSPPTVEDAGPSTTEPTTASSTTGPETTTSGDATTEAPGVSPPTRTLVVENLLGDRFELTTPATSDFSYFQLVMHPWPVPTRPEAALDLTVEQGDAAAVAWSVCNGSGLPGCVETERTVLASGNTFVRWRLRNLRDPNGPFGSAPELATVSNGEWTLALRGPDEAEARRVADLVSVATSATGGPRIVYSDPSTGSLPFPGFDATVAFGPAPGQASVSLSLAHGCEDLRASSDQCIDDAGVGVSGDDRMVAALNQVLQIRRLN